MLDHVSITVDELGAAIVFYDAVLGALGHHRVYRTESAAGYGKRNCADDDTHTYLSIVAQQAITPDDRHWAFRAPTRAAVDEFQRVALVTGGDVDAGAALRPEYHVHYYSAFIRDPSGNRIEAVCHHDRHQHGG